MWVSLQFNRRDEACHSCVFFGHTATGKYPVFVKLLLKRNIFHEFYYKEILCYFVSIIKNLPTVCHNLNTKKKKTQGKNICLKSSKSNSLEIIYKHVISGNITYVCDDVKTTEQSSRLFCIKFIFSSLQLVVTNMYTLVNCNRYFNLLHIYTKFA